MDYLTNEISSDMQIHFDVLIIGRKIAGINIKVCVKNGSCIFTNLYKEDR